MFKDLVEFCVVSLDLLNALASGFKTAGGGPLLSSTYRDNQIFVWNQLYQRYITKNKLYN